MARSTTPFDLWLTGLRLARLAAEAQGVILLRTLGILGIWSVAPSEMTRMFTEKPPAFARAASAATKAALAGRPPLDAAIGPLQSRAGANLRRLSRRGPAKPRIRG